MALQIGFLLFPQVQQLDLTGPHDVLASLPDVQVHLLWKEPGPVVASSGWCCRPPPALPTARRWMCCASPVAPVLER